MKFDNKTYQNLAYGLLALLFLYIIIYCFNFKYAVIQDLSFRDRTNQNSNSRSNKVVEGFGGSGSLKDKFKKDDDIYALIERKLKGLGEELGGDKGKKEVKQILTNTKKICDLECAKCMMNMIEENKGIKSLDLDKLAEDDSSEYCVKCKNYTALSTSIKSMIDNL